MKPSLFNLPASGEVLVQATHLHKRYTLQHTTVVALNGVSLQIRRGEVAAIMGPSGCGKTTLLNCLSGLDDFDEGSVKIVGCDLRTLTDNELTRFRALHMGFIFQTYNLLPVLTGVENVELPLLVGGVKAKEARRHALEAIEQVGLLKWATHKPAEMSGGQRQRFTVARALATRPAIVWADEPTGALDSETSHEMIDLMLQLNRQHGLTFVWVTHDTEVAAQAQRVITMRDGQITQDRQLSSREILEETTTTQGGILL